MRFLGSIAGAHSDLTVCVFGKLDASYPFNQQLEFSSVKWSSAACKYAHQRSWTSAELDNPPYFTEHDFSP